MVYLFYREVIVPWELIVWSIGAIGLFFATIWDVKQENIFLASCKVEQAREQMEKGQHLAATECLKKALEYDPDNFEAIVVKGELQRTEQSYEEARRTLLKANEINPNSFRVHFALGLTFLQEKKVLEAISEFKQTIRLNPQFCESYYILAQSFELSGNKSDALLSYRKFLEVVTSEDLSNSKIKDYVERSTARMRVLS